MTTLEESRHTYEMGLIGNCSFLAYVDKTTNVCWQCLPRFDSSFIFGGLLDPDKGGRFVIEPREPMTAGEQSYVENTNILQTEITTESGRYRVTDFAPRFSQYSRYFKPLMLVRKLEPLEGQPMVRVICEPKGSYGAVEPDVSLGSNHIRFLGLQESVRLTTNIPLNYVSQRRYFLLDRPKYLVFTWGVPLQAPLEETAENFLRQTTQYWRHWVETCSIPNVYQNEVIRSSLILKLHQYEDTGAIIASGTTSLPESRGSGRNWDYRYFWVRDTYYTLNAFSQLGHFEELGQYSSFLRNVAAQNGAIDQPMYTILGDKEIPESEVDLAGYLGEKPVRVGNAAYYQTQNDVYGQAILSLLPLYIDQRVSRRRPANTLMIHHLLDSIEQTMDQPDAGLWELRGSKKRHCYTFLFHWAGACAAERIARAYKEDDLLKRAGRLRQEASKQIEKCFRPEGFFSSSVENSEFDAALFHLITMQYLSPSDPRAKSHLQALEKNLCIDGQAFFYRYNHHDDFGLPEVAFLICGFWYVGALIQLNELDKAMRAFDRLLGSGNHLGLLSEDVDVKNLSQWGNFVQTYSHVGVINCAFDLDRKLNRPSFLSPPRP